MIDWVSLTTSCPSDAYALYKTFLLHETDGVWIRKNHSSWTVNLSGRYWADLPDENFGIRRVHAACLQGFKITRVDFAWDCPGDFATAFQEANPECTYVRSPTGTTVYLGERSSSRFLRVYDKAKEIKAKTGVDVDFALTRVELECKREVAVENWRVYSNGDLDAIRRDVCSRYRGLEFLGQDTGQRICVQRLGAGNAMEFVRRFRRVIRAAVSSDPVEFIGQVGVSTWLTVAGISPGSADITEEGGEKNEALAKTTMASANRSLS